MLQQPFLAADGLRRQWIPGRWCCLGAPLLFLIKSLQLGVVAQFGGATRPTHASPGSVHQAAGWDGPSGRGRSPASAARRPRGFPPAAGERCRPVSRPTQALHPDQAQRPRPNEPPRQHPWSEERAERRGAAPTVHCATDGNGLCTAATRIRMGRSRYGPSGTVTPNPQPPLPGKMGPCRHSGGHCQLSRSAAVFRWRRIDSDNLRLTPAASAAAPAAGMPLASLLVDAGALLADCINLASIALIGCHEPDAAVAVLVVVPIHKDRHPVAGLLDALEWPAGVVRPVFTARQTATTQC